MFWTCRNGQFEGKILLTGQSRVYKTGFKALQWVISNTTHTWLIYLLLLKFNTGLYERQDRLKALQWAISNTAHTWLVYLLLVNTGLYEWQDRLKALSS